MDLNFRFTGRPPGASQQPGEDPPVLVRRAAFAALMTAAKRAAQDPSALDDLVAAAHALEAERRETEWDAEDAKTTPGSYIGDEHGYFRWMQIAPEARDQPGSPAIRPFWRQADQEITVVVEPPVSTEQMARLERFGIARRAAPSPLPAAPFNVYYVSDPKWLTAVHMPPFGVETTPAPPGGSWIVAGPDRQRIAWARSGLDAAYLAAAVNMALRLEKDVMRFGYGDLRFPPHIEKTGLLGLIRWLRMSIEPQERWEAPPPEALESAGAELEKHLIAFMEALNRKPDPGRNA